MKSLRRTRLLLFLLTGLLSVYRTAHAQRANLNARMLAAARQGEYGVVYNLLDKGADVNAGDKKGMRALMFPVSWVQHDLFFAGMEEASAHTVERLLKRGADINAKNRMGMTALMYAAGWHHFPSVSSLLNAGADVSIRDRRGRTALTWAARDGKDNPAVTALRLRGVPVGVVEALLMGDTAALQSALEANRDLATRGPYDETALMAAAEKGCETAVLALLAKGASPNDHDTDGLCALMFAFAGREQHSIPAGSVTMTDDAKDPARLRIVRALLEHGANPDLRDKRGFTILLWAIKVGTPEMVQALLEAGADVNLADTYGLTPLLSAIADRRDLVPLLLDHGADVNRRTEYGSPLNNAVRTDDATLVDSLLARGAGLSLPLATGKTPVMEAATTSAAMLTHLLARGVDALARDRYGWSALTYALSVKKQETIPLLRAKGIKLGLMDALFMNDTAKVEEMLNAGANPNAPQQNGETALVVAVSKGNLRSVRALLAKGADPNILSGWEGAPLIARIVGSVWGDVFADENVDPATRVELLKTLLEHGARVNAVCKRVKETPLTLAVMRGELDMVQALLAHGADVARRDTTHKTALMYAVETKNAEIEAALRQAGAKE